MVYHWNMDPITYLQTTDISLAALIGYVEEKQVEPTGNNKLSDYESIDMTTSSQELACVAGGCEIV